MKLNYSKLFVTASAAGFVALNIYGQVVKTRQIVIEEKSARKTVKVNAARDIAAIEEARDTITDMLREGLYDGKPLTMLMSDLNSLIKINQAK